jgi:hypothetical protein
VRRLTILAVLGLAMAACAQPAPTPPRQSPPASAPPSPAPTIASPDPTPAPTLSPQAGPPKLDPAAVLQVCESWPGGAAEPAIPCADAIEAAFASLAPPAVSRIDMRFTCPGPDTCPAADPDRAWVTVSDGSTATMVELARDADGGLSVVGTSPGALPAAPPFTPPPVARPDIAGAPASVAGRVPYPLCGDEKATMGGPYDVAARTCFLSGVLAGSPVEFISRSSGTEGEDTLALYRFDGRGGVEMLSMGDGAWTTFRTGIAAPYESLVFDVDGVSSKRVPAP